MGKRTKGITCWIEVTTGIRWGRMLAERNIRLDAPNTARYRNFFRGLKAGDLVLHYLTITLTPASDKRGCVAWVSGVESSPALAGDRIVAKCWGTLELPRPVPCKKLRELRGKSAQLTKLVRMCMQRYLTRITHSDFESILGLYPENMKRFLKSPLARLYNRSGGREFQHQFTC